MLNIFSESSIHNRVHPLYHFKMAIHCFLWFVLCFVLFAKPTFAETNSFHLSSQNVTRLKLEYLKTTDVEQTWQSVYSSDPEQNWQRSDTFNNAIGYYDGTIWAKAVLDNNTTEGEWRLRIPNSFIQFLDVYVIDSQGNLQSEYHTGSHRRYRERPIANRYFVFPFELQQHKKTTVLIKIKSQFGIYVPCEIYSEKTFNEIDVTGALWLGSFLGIIVVMAIYNLFLYFSTGQLAYLCYVVFVLCNFLYQASHTGIASQLLWPNQFWIIEQSFYFFSVLTFLSASIFIYVFLDMHRDGPFLRYFSYFLIGSWTLLAIANFFIQIEYTQNICNLLGLVSCLFALSVGAYKYFLGVEIAKYFTIAWFTMVSATFLVILKYAGVWPNLTYAEMIQKIGTVVEVVLLSLALGVKIKQLRQEKQQAQSEALSAQQQNRAKSTFLATMSHEIRTPINGVLGITDLLMDTSLNKQQSEWLSHIKTSGHTLLRVINDILDYSKIEAGKLEIEHISLSLPEIIASCRAVFQSQSKVNGIQLLIQIDDALNTPVLGDPTRIRQMLLNYLSNAFKFTHHGSITINAELIQQKCNQPLFRLSVTDEGIGIDPEKCQNLFTEFTQAETDTTRQFGGTGLGLSITKRLAELMGGSVGVKSELGKGSTFWFDIPYQPTSTTERQNKEHEFDSTAFSQFNRKVLIAEDNKVNQVVIKNMLRKMGLQIDLCENGVQVVEQFKAAPEEYHLILMDCEMPELNGFDATKFIRAYERVKGLNPIPIIALTAHAMEESHQQCFASGMWDVIVKPFDRTVLAEKILQHSQVTQSSPPALTTTQ